MSDDSNNLQFTVNSAQMFIERLNDDLSAFIRERIEFDSNMPHPREDFASFSQCIAPPKCWEVMGCGETDCPAYGVQDVRCWLESGTMCEGVASGEFAQKLHSCFNCTVFKQAVTHSSPLQRLYENINILIFHLESRAQQLKLLALKDNLTGLYNRHYFDEVIPRVLAQSRRGRQDLSLLSIDVDGLKQVNDSFGHTCGDSLLQVCAALISQNIRTEDVAFRFGGDEFAVLMQDVGRRERDQAIQRLHDEVERWNLMERSTWLVGLSIGGATCQFDDYDVTALLQRADEKMYAEKQQRKQLFRHLQRH